MFGRKKKQQKKEEHRQAVRKGLIFWLPGGSSRIDVYLDYCVVQCLGKTKLPEKERVIPFNDVKDVIYTPATPSRMASLQLITKQMPDVKRSYWYAYENNLIVVHPNNEKLAKNIRAYILNPKGSDVVPPEYLNLLWKEEKQRRREEAEAKEKAEQEAKEQAKAEKAEVQSDPRAEPAPSTEPQAEAAPAPGAEPEKPEEKDAE